MVASRTVKGTFIVDIDGTLAIRDYGQDDPRHWFAWGRVGEDAPNMPVVEVVRALKAVGHQIVYISGRSDVCRYQTQLWLSEKVGVMGILLMRPEGDYRPDFVVKRELYEKYVLPYEGKPIAVLDDRNSVVEMWREELGLVCLQVAEGDF